ncbi:MAG: hypothetical protein VYA34_02475 [Myxococcota bacterium]|nr:hypothetical protein [Myxococcota bacterium]
MPRASDGLLFRPPVVGLELCCFHRGKLKVSSSSSELVSAPIWDIDTLHLEHHR